MARTPVRGCPDQREHAAHEWSDLGRGRKSTLTPRWCPGRVRCENCRRNIFRSTAAETVNGWVCAGRCR